MRELRPTTKLAAFSVVLAGSFGVGAALGGALPDLGPASGEPEHAPYTTPTEPAHGGGHQP